MFIERLGPELGPLRDLLARNCEEIVCSGTDVLVSHRPAIGSEAYALALHAPLSESELADYEKVRGIAIPPHYASILRSMNGGQIFELSLYGLPRSMLGIPPLLDRSARQPLDLATANQFWRSEFKAPMHLFHFGSGALSLDENVGYFLDASGAVEALRKNGSTWRHWPSFITFLAAEIDRLERAFPAFEAFMADTIRPAR